MKIILKAIKHIGIGIYYVGKAVKSTGSFLEDFAVKKLNG